MSEYLSSFRLRNQENLSAENLDRRHIELSALFELSQSLNSTLDLSAILSNLLFVPMGRMMIGKGCILLPQPQDQRRFTVSTVKGLPRNLIGQEIELKIQPNDVFFSEQLGADAPDLFVTNKIDLIIPIQSRGELRGLMTYGKKLTQKPYEEEEIHFLKSLGMIAAPAIENARVVEKLSQVNRQLDHKVQELNTLFEIGKELNRVFERDEILKRLSYSLMGQMLINQFIVALCQDEESKELITVYKKGLSFNKLNVQSVWDTSDPLAESSAPHIINASGSRVEKKLNEANVQVITPMVLQGRVQGYIFLGPKMNKEPYNSGEMDFLSTLANIAIISLENARLFEETLEKKRLEEELALAKSIQSRLLPSAMPQISRFNIHGINIPSKHVGGDYFDIIQLNHEEVLLTIADVSGKGMPASLLMSNLQAGIRTLQNEPISLAEMTFRLNNLIFQNTNVEKYITFFIARLNTNTNKLSYVNAGHNPPYLFHSDNSFDVLDKGGIILGMMADMEYETGEVEMPPSSLLTMFTDGVTEAMSPQEEPFDEERVIDFYTHIEKSLNCEELNKKLIEALYEFAGDPTKDDDITVLCIKRLE